ncbi:TIGR01906 family membrane protein [Apilactobacillus apisilvae]|uniref:TIGR01906 family membrane protein n=1 Tax=Apilactobacillus apisilvae TaxID=2923364 RepID=UPI0037BF4BDC
MLKWYIKLLLIIICVISAGIFIIINVPFLYRIIISFFDINFHTHKSVNILMNNYNNVITYLQSPFITNMQTSFLMNQNGFNHFRDVKNLILINNLVMFISLPISIKFYISFKRKKYRWIFIRPLKTLNYLILFFGLFILLDFNDFFIKFHQIFFRNNNWVFDAKSNPIILAFPDEYFLICTVLIFVLFLFSCFYLINRGYKDLK